MNLVGLHSISLPCDPELITRLGEFGLAESGTRRDCTFDLQRGVNECKCDPLRELHCTLGRIHERHSTYFPKKAR